MTVILFVLTVGSSTLWMTRALDHQALIQSTAQMRAFSENLLARARMITLDYTKWDAAVAAMREPDETWIHDNIGLGTRPGRAVQFAAVWGGSFSGDFGWTDRSDRKAVTGLLSESTRNMIEERLAAVPMGAEDGVEFFAWQDGYLFAFGAARFEPLDDATYWATRGGDNGRLVMGIRLTDTVLGSAAESLMLQDVRITADRPEERPSLPLLGVEGQVVAHLAWAGPRPGTTMLRSLSPWLMIVTALTCCLATLSMRLLRRSAKHLVEAEQRASMSARSDALTGLPNRAAFHEALTCSSDAGSRAILFLDINGFKRINDSMGHAAGDAVLKSVARRLRGFRNSSRLVARISGDEFMLMINSEHAGSEIETLAHSVDAAIAQPMLIAGQMISVRAAMGYSIQGTNPVSGNDLVRQADLAMYEAKRQKSQGPVAFCALLDQASHNAHRIEQSLRSCLTTGEGLSIAYQPIVTTDGLLHRAEALARWNSPDLGPIPPSRFIPIAERAGLIHELSRRIFAQVCLDLVRYPRLQVSINVSPLQLVSPGFLTGLMVTLASHRLSSSRVEVELTESILVDDPKTARAQLVKLRDAGFTVALDDFGTGYSSITYLEQLTFDTLKIDRSFVQGLRTSKKRLALIRTMIEMAHGLGLQVVSEGVETAEGMDRLIELGCDFVQGYYLDKAMSADALSQRWIEPTAARVAA